MLVDNEKTACPQTPSLNKTSSDIQADYQTLSLHRNFSMKNDFTMKNDFLYFLNLMIPNAASKCFHSDQYLDNAVPFWGRMADNNTAQGDLQALHDDLAHWATDWLPDIYLEGWAATRARDADWLDCFH